MWIPDNNRVPSMLDKPMLTPETPTQRSPQQSHGSTNPCPPCISNNDRDLATFASCGDIPSRNIRQRSLSFYGTTSHPHVTSPRGQSDVSQSESLDFLGISLDLSSTHL